MAEFYETSKRDAAKLDRTKVWKTKRKKEHRPRMFNERDVGCKPISQDMDKIGHIYFKTKTQYLEAIRAKEMQVRLQYEANQKLKIKEKFRRKLR